MNREFLPGTRRIFIDTSAWVALVRAADDKHEKARDIVNEAIVAKARLYVTNFVIAEIHAFLVSRASIPIATRFLMETSQTTFNIVRVTPDDEETSKRIILKFSDKDFSFTDGTSFAVMDRLKIDTAFTFDRHFSQYGFNVLH